MALLRRLVRKNTLVNLTFIVALLLVGHNTYQVVRRSFALKKESAATKAKIEQLTRRKQELEAQITELKSAPAVERQAKERLNMKNSGEEVVVVVPEKNTVPQKKSAATPPSFWDRLKGFFR